MIAKVINTLGKEVGTVELNDEIFGREYNEALIHQVIVAQLANKRQGTKSALTRTEVRGGGRKPWRQKGTGRARQGSIRAPQWTHGGVVFAPKPRDFSKKINNINAFCRTSGYLSIKNSDPWNSSPVSLSYASCYQMRSRINNAGFINKVRYIIPKK